MAENIENLPVIEVAKSPSGEAPADVGITDSSEGAMMSTYAQKGTVQPDDVTATREVVSATTLPLDYQYDEKQMMANVSTAISADIEDMTETELLGDETWGYGSKRMFRTVMGEDFTGTDEEAAQFGIDLMRRVENNLVELGDFTHTVKGMKEDDAKIALYMMDMFEAKDFTGRGFAQALGYMGLDPTTYIGLGTFGFGFAGKEAAKQGTKQGIKAALQKIAYSPVTIGAVEGGFYTGIFEHGKQTVSEAAGEGYDSGSVGLNVAIGGAAGAAAGKYLPEIFDYAGEKVAKWSAAKNFKAEVRAAADAGDADAIQVLADLELLDNHFDGDGFMRRKLDEFEQTRIGQAVTGIQRVVTDDASKKNLIYHGGGIESIEEIQETFTQAGTQALLGQGADPIKYLGINFAKEKDIAESFSKVGGGKMLQAEFKPKKTKKYKSDNVILNELLDRAHDRSGANFWKEAKGIKDIDEKNEFMINNLFDSSLVAEMKEDLIEKGYDSIQFKNTLDGGITIIPLTKDVIKNVASREELARLVGDGVSIIDSDGRAVIEDAPAFYSQLEAAIKGSNQKTWNKQQLQGFLKKQGVKDEEIKWSGIQEYLDGLDGKAKVNTQDLLDELNPPQLEKKTLEESELKYQSHVTKDIGTNYREELTMLPKDFKDTVYRSSHWDESNVLYHVRKQDTKIDGDSTLLIEEIQSDWHQEGRKKGYRTDEVMPLSEINEKIKILEEKRKEIISDADFYKDENKVNELQKLGDEVAELSALHSDHYSKVPQAPYSKTWHEKAMKDQIAEAVEKDYDRVAWIAGNEQVERYSLSRQINDLTAVKMDDGRYDIKVNGKSRNLGRWEEDKLSDAVGKEMAQKIINDGGGSYSGTDLEIGGEGMKAFYDKMLPKWTNKYIKKFDSKVETKELSNGQEVWSFEVTDKMKKATKEKGQALYSAGASVGAGAISLEGDDDAEQQ